MQNKFDDLDPPPFDWIDIAILIAFVLTLIVSTLLMLDLTAGILEGFFGKVGYHVGTAINWFFNTIWDYWVGLTN